MKKSGRTRPKIYFREISRNFPKKWLIFQKLWRFFVLPILRPPLSLFLPSHRKTSTPFTRRSKGVGRALDTNPLPTAPIPAQALHPGTDRGVSATVTLLIHACCGRLQSHFVYNHGKNHKQWPVYCTHASRNEFSRFTLQRHINITFHVHDIIVRIQRDLRRAACTRV